MKIVDEDDDCSVLTGGTLYKCVGVSFACELMGGRFV